MIMDIVNVVTIGHCDHNVSNEHKALYAEIQTLRAKVEVLVEDLSKVQKNLKRPINTVNGSVTISFTFVDEALATYDKLSEVKE